MRWRQLRLLLWKSVYLYKLRRNWIITALEVITPLLLTSVQVYLHCRWQSQAKVRPPSIGPTNRTFDPDAPVTLMLSPLAFPRVLGFVPAPGPANETGETLLRDAFSGIGLELEEFPDESRLVENLTRHKNALGLANNYGVVFLRAGDGMLSYVLRFPSWQEFYTRETRTNSDSERMPQYWLYGILLPLVAGINMAQARREALSTGRRLPSVSFKTRRFPTPSSSPSGGGRSVRRLIDLCVVYGFIVIAPVAVKRIADEKSVGMKVWHRL
ncbi:unnamed protein product, partial [Ixodes pacificus]